MQPIVNIYSSSLELNVLYRSVGSQRRINESVCSLFKSAVELSVCVPVGIYFKQCECTVGEVRWVGVGLLTMREV